MKVGLHSKNMWWPLIKPKTHNSLHVYKYYQKEYLIVYMFVLLAMVFMFQFSR